MVVINYKTKVCNDTMPATRFKFNTLITGCTFRYQLRSQYNDALLYEAELGDGIVEDGDMAIVVQPYQLAFLAGQHRWELERTDIEGNIKTIARGILPLIKEIVQ